jgi:hypothetical protein
MSCRFPHSPTPAWLVRRARQIIFADQGANPARIAGFATRPAETQIKKGWRMRIPDRGKGIDSGYMMWAWQQNLISSGDTGKDIRST